MEGVSMDVIKKYNHLFTDYYGIIRSIDTTWLQFHNPVNDSYGTRYVYRFPTSLDVYNKIIKTYSEYFDAITERSRLAEDIAIIEVNYTDKQKWYAEMMYDGALLPMEKEV